MASERRSSNSPVHRRTRNDTIIAEREINTKGGIEKKKDEIAKCTKRIRQLNKDNLRKDEEINNIDQMIYDLVVKHNVSLDILRTEHEGKRSDLDYDVKVLENKVDHLKKLVERGKGMEQQNLELRAERDMLMRKLRETEDAHNKLKAGIKNEVVIQQEKLEKQFKKELVIMEAKYRQAAFDKLSDKKKKALLENAKLQEEIVMQKIGMVNLGERMLLEENQLEDLRKEAKMWEQKGEATNQRIAVLRRKSYAYDARMSDMDVTLTRLVETERLLQLAQASQPLSLAETRRACSELLESERALKSSAMKWKARYIQMLSLVEEEKGRKLEAMRKTRDSKFGPEFGIGNVPEGSSEMTATLTDKLRVWNEVSSEQFARMWGRIMENWRREDGKEGLESRKKSRGRRSRGGRGMGGGSRGGLATKAGTTLGGVLTTSESVPILTSLRGGKVGGKTVQSTPKLELPKFDDSSVDSSVREGGGGEGNGGGEPVSSSDSDSEAEVRGGGDDSLPMLNMAGKKSILDEDFKMVSYLKAERARATKERDHQRAIAEGRASLNVAEDEAKSEAGSEVSKDSIHLWIEDYRGSKRLDIRATGFKKEPLGNIGAGALKQDGDVFDLNGGLKGPKGVPPRKRLVDSLMTYKNPGKSRLYLEELGKVRHFFTPPPPHPITNLPS
ncbi:hypothetical protein TrCOL_g13897 [Triparma columacea]|uniref:Uncharacterized protein n=1 Tax=Triparma columacea TaxID=722753 RepID=A0A9W7GIN2_9STRA|nr:hypothetical protein TrCOL_g13897 [Triparma columacea]